MMKEGNYFGTHWYWDDEDREYIICATWFFEKNYPDMPDYWILKDIEVEVQEPSAPDLDLTKGGNVWRYIDEEGVPDGIREEDYEQDG